MLRIDAISSVLRRERDCLLTRTTLSRVRLLERTSQRVALTEAGRTVLRDAYRLIGQIEQLKVNARRASAEAPIKLRIGVLATLLPWVAALQPREGQATAYVCHQFACQQPAASPEQLRTQLDTLLRA